MNALEWKTNTYANLCDPVACDTEKELLGSQMEDVKKRKLDKATSNGDEISPDSEEDLRTLLDPLAKPQLVDLLAKLCVQLFTFPI